MVCAKDFSSDLEKETGEVKWLLSHVKIKSWERDSEHVMVYVGMTYRSRRR